MTEAEIAGYSISAADSKITLPNPKQMARIIEILLSNRLLRLKNEPHWQIIAERRFPPRRSRIWNKLEAFLLNIDQFIPIVCAFTHEVCCFCFDCGQELNTVSVLITKTTEGKSGPSRKEERIPNLACYCPNCDFVIQAHESIWADDDDDGD